MSIIMDDEITQLLLEYGLKPKEIKIYKLLFEGNSLTSYQISKEVVLHRSSVEGMLKKLIELGFVKSEVRNKKTYYFGNDITNLISDLHSKKLILDNLLPAYEKSKIYYEPKVNQYDGINGQKQFNYNFFQYIKENTEFVYVIGNTMASSVGSHLLLRDLLRTFTEVIKDKEYKAIWNSKYKFHEELRDHKVNIGEHKYLDDLPSVSTTLVYEDHVAFLFSSSKPYVIEIYSKSLSLEFKKYFHYLWTISRD